MNERNLFFVSLLLADCNNKKSINTEKITELQQKIDRIKSNIDAIGLQQKVVDKKIANTVKLQENLQNELDETKNRREVLLMEIVDLQLGKHIHS